MQDKKNNEPKLQTISEDRIQRIVALSKEENKKTAGKKWSIKEIFNVLDTAIVGNVPYKKSLSVSIGDFLSDAMIKNHILVMGPSGTGKTYLLEQTLPDIGLPYTIIDMSSLVPSGYKGNTLGESLELFYSKNRADERHIIVIDEFDKVSVHANGNDAFKSQSIQSELLTLVQGKKEGKIDTRNSLWILVGAFAYVDEFKESANAPNKNELIKYGFKNELLGRIVKVTNTEAPTLEQMIRIISGHKVTNAFVEDFKNQNKEVHFDDSSLLKLAQASMSPNFGIRNLPSIFASLKEHFTFSEINNDKIIVSSDIVDSILNQI